MYIFHREITCSINTVVELKSRFPQFSNAAFYQGITDSDQDDHHSKWDRWWGGFWCCCCVPLLYCVVRALSFSVFRSLRAVARPFLVVGGLGGLAPTWCGEAVGHDDNARACFYY